MNPVLETLEPARMHAGLMDLQHALDLSSMWRATRNLIKSALQLHSCSLMHDINGYEPRFGQHLVVEAPHAGYEPATTLRVSQRYLDSHPQVKLYTYSQIVSEDPTAPERRLEQEPFNGAWAEFVHLAFWHDARLEAVLSIRRGEGHPCFTRDELVFLERVYPTIESALRRLRAFENECAKRLMLERYLDATPFPVMFIDADGALLFATAEARRWYERWTGGAARLRSRDANLKLPPEIGALLERATLGIGRTKSSSEELSVRHPSIPGLTVRADVSWPAFSTSQHPSYILTFTMTGSDGAANRELSADALRLLQRLSPTERRVALLVLEGLRNDEISQRLCRSRRTIEFQLNSIYRKLDVSSRTHLVRLMA